MKNTIKKLIFTSLMLVFISYSYLFSSEKTYGKVCVSSIVKVYDGDTITVNIKKYPPIVGEEISVRIYGIDTPEIKGKTEYEKKKAIEARDYIIKRLNEGTKVELRNIRRDKYFRILFEVWVYIPKRGWIDLSKELIEKGLARPYFGETKEEWKEP